METLLLGIIFLLVTLIVVHILRNRTAQAPQNTILETDAIIAAVVAAQQQTIQQRDEYQLKNIFENLESLKNLQKSTDELRNILSNNQLRGLFGQTIAENLLQAIGFTKDNYISQEQQNETGKRPDLTVLLPDKTKINIDVKFPFQALEKYYKAEEPAHKKQYLSEFKTHIKNKINDLKSRDYINPTTTVDFVIMFIPNENIFSFIYDNCTEEYKNAMTHKIIMCGPISFTAILRIVQQTHDNFKYQKNLSNIISHIKSFKIECEKSDESLNSLRKRFEQLSDDFKEVSDTRTKKLKQAIDKILQSEEATLLPSQDSIEAP